MESTAPHDRMIQPIGIIRSCFGEKFGAPRQPGLVPDAWAELIFHPEFRHPDMLRGIEGFSHLWLIFGFHQTVDQGWHPTVRPPRLGGNERVGVFASRSTYRPNGLGLSVVQLRAIRNATSCGPILELQGIDLIDGTPIYDIKPYLPYSDSIPSARSGFASAPLTRLMVELTPQANLTFESMDERTRNILVQSLELDPRPAICADDATRIHGVLLCGYNVRFRVDGSICHILDISRR